MNIITKFNSFAAFDGKILLRTKIDMPAEIESSSSKYLSEYSSHCALFAQKKLLPILSDRYNEQYRERRGMPWHTYAFSITETYSENGIESFLMKSVLEQNNVIHAVGIRTVIFDEDTIIPPNLVCKRREARDASLVLFEGGVPTIVSVSSLELKFQRMIDHRNDYKPTDPVH